MSTQVPDDRPVADDAAYLPEPVLPEPVRQRVIALAAAALTGLPADELPVPLRRVAKFAPNRRARLAGTAIATQLSGDPLFRQRLAGRVLEEAGDLGAAVLEGACPAAADPVEVAALAYLGRPAGWTELVEAAGEIVRAEAESAAMTELLRDAEQRAARAEHDRAVARVEADKLRDELARLREEAAGLREENRTLNRALREAQAREKRAAELVATEKGRLNRTLSAPRRPARSTTPGSGCCWRPSGRPPSGCGGSWPWSRRACSRRTWSPPRRPGGRASRPARPARWTPTTRPGWTSSSRCPRRT